MLAWGVASREIERIRKFMAAYNAAAEARGVMPVSDVPGEGFGSFAEDDPEVHESFRNRYHGLPEDDGPSEEQDEG